MVSLLKQMFTHKPPNLTLQLYETVDIRDNCDIRGRKITLKFRLPRELTKCISNVEYYFILCRKRNFSELKYKYHISLFYAKSCSPAKI